MITTTVSSNRGIALGTSGDVADCRVRMAAPVVNTSMKTPVDYRITAELCASSFAGGHVWLRPATLDVLVQTTPGHLAWRPPT